MADLLPIDATAVSGSSVTSKAAASPLAQLLSDLRRKYAAAAGPQVGSVSDDDVLSYARDINAEGVDVARRRNDDENEEPLGIWPLPQSPRSPRDRSRSTSSRSQSMASENVPTSPRKKSSGGHLTSSKATRHRSDLAPKSHAENLLCSTPHLRHLSIASADMEGRGTFSSSRNLFSHLLPNSHQSAPGISSLDATISSSSKKGKGSTSSMADYRTAVARSHANRAAALGLASFVRILTHEMSLEDFASVENEVFTSIFALVHSTDNGKRLAGVAALDALIGVASSDEEKKAIKFANNLSNGLKANNVDYEFLAAVSHALGRMAMGAANVDYVEFEVTRALEWLRTDRSDRRLAATLTLKELARNAPTSFYAKTNQTAAGHGGSNEFLDHIWPVLRDPQPVVRICASDALAECLKILVERKHRSLVGLLCQLHSNMMMGFKQESKKRSVGAINVGAQPSIAGIAEIEAAQHSSLLVLGDMLDHCGSFMLPRSDEVSCACLELKSHAKALIRLEVARLIPRLARCCPESFGRRYLKESLAFLIDSASNAPPRAGVDLRPAAFHSIGQLAIAMSDRNGEGVIRSTIQIIGGTENGKSSEIIYNFEGEEGDIYSRLDEIFSLVRSGLQKARQTPSSSEALRCGADLVDALGAHAESYIPGLLDDMFQSGLSEDLISCLHSISHRLPNVKKLIEDRLLQELSICLAGAPFAHCDPVRLHESESKGHTPMSSARTVSQDFGGTVKHLLLSHPRLDSYSRHGYVVPATVSGSRDTSCTTNMSTDQTTVMKLVLSLRTLGSFENSTRELGGYGLFATLLPFVRDVVAQYLAHPSSDVRREAALTCCLLLLPYGDSTNHASPQVKASCAYGQVGRCSGKLLSEVLQKLLRVAVSDSSTLVRHCVVRALDDRYDHYLCQAHNLPPLFLLLNDEALSVRASALHLLGRLALINPAPILPVLRRSLIELVLELRCGGDAGGGREAATRLLIVFLRADALHRLVHPFLPSIIEALPLRGVAPRLASASLEALGELAQVARSSLTPWVHQLVPHILETLQDQSSASKQRTSLRTLGQIAGATGYVVSPYLDYPQLLPQAADVLPGTKRAPWALRREVIRTLGILGALDPDRYHTHKARKGGGVGGGYFIETENEKDLGTTRRGMSSSLKATSFKTADFNGKDSIPSAAATTSSALPASQSPDTSAATVAGLRSVLSDSVTIKDADDNEPAHLYMYGQYAMTAVPVSDLPPARRLTPSDEDFYPTVAVQALTRILKDPSLAVHHGMVMQAVMYIFNSLGLRCVQYLPLFVPHILKTIRTCGQISLREALLQQVASLAGIVRDHLRPYVPSIFEVVEEFWSATPHVRTVLALIETMAKGVPDDFRKYVPRLVPQILQSIEASQIQTNWTRQTQRGSIPSISETQKLTKILQCVTSLRGTLGDYLHILVPALMKLADTLVSPTMCTVNSSTANSHARLAVLSIQTAKSMLLQSTDNLPVESVTIAAAYESVVPTSKSLPARAAQPLMRLLGKESNANKAVGLAAIEALCVSAKQLGRARWMPFYHVAARDAIVQWQVRVGIGGTDALGSTGNSGSRGESKHDELSGLTLYDEMIRDLVFPSSQSNILARLQPADLGGSHRQDVGFNDTTLTGFDISDADADLPQPSIQPINQTNKHRVNQSNLQRSWDCSQRTTREDWDEWMRRFAVQLLREAPSPALRATAGLAQAYQPLSRELFSAAFYCCWGDLNDQYRQNLVNSLEAAFVADVSPEILQTLLNLAEFMEHDGVEGGLPIDIAVLAELALKCRSYAKALHYKEREHNAGASGGACVDALISINKKLDLGEAATGCLSAVQMELERRSMHTRKDPHFAYTNSRQRDKSGFPSKFFHQHHALDMAYTVMSTENEISATGGGPWGVDILQESWLARLGSWAEALAMYESKLEENPDDDDAVLGCLKCLDARGEWKRVLNLAGRSWKAVSGSADTTDSPGGPLTRNHRKALKFCSQAAWRLGQWDQLDTYSSQLFGGNDDPSSVTPGSTSSGLREGIPRVDFDGAFYSAVLNIHRQEWSVAADAIDAARKAMDSRFTALMAESYKRSYPSMVTAMLLAEMEEIIAYRKIEGRVKVAATCHPTNRADDAEARKQLLAVWRHRLAGCRVDAEVHSSILAVRSLVLGPADEIDATLTLSALSRQSQCFMLAERLLLDPLDQLGADINGAVFGFGLPASLGLGLKQTIEDSITTTIDRLVTDDSSYFLPQYCGSHQQYTKMLVQEAGGLDRLNIQHQLYYAYVKHLWEMDHHEDALGRLANLCDVVDLVHRCERSKNATSGLRVSCWLKLGYWKASGNPPGLPLPDLLQVDVLAAYKRATYSSDCGYKAWHAWALLNFRLAQQNHESAASSCSGGAAPGAARSSRSVRPPKLLRNHVVAAVQGFVRAITLGTKRWSASVQQDMLNFLTCLFKYGDFPEVASMINASIDSVTLEAWLGVLPQLLARIHIKSPSVRSVLHPLLVRLGAKHPQALMYPLSVLLKSPVLERKSAAAVLMNSLKASNNALVEEALMVSSELIRVAILWLELWWEGLEDASRLYFGEGNVSGMLDVLMPLHEQLERGPTTRREHDFFKAFGHDLAEAHAYVQEYVRLTTSGGGVIPSAGGFIGASTQAEPEPPGLSAVRQNAEAEAKLNQAWDLYYTVFRRINKELPGLTSLELSQCSPALLQARNLELGVPGSYRVDGSYVKIESFIPRVQVITSKQRPRKITIRGSDGNDYVFLLKGHEDLRQDERVMQLFGLVNALLARDRRTNNHDLNIQRYAIAPLSHNAGVVGWVPHCDTMHSLIRDYRETKKIPLNMENREMMKLAPNYDLLTVMQKVEVFSEALERTAGRGDDLYEVLWIKSTNSEEWLERRTKYSRSLAVMSMVGYILGLGDRHPSNLMLDQISGRVLHIDFGDCFEVAMHREKFPEKIPFRLTRMLIKAMEVSGIEGSYRSTCERTMGVLRDNRDSLVAMLEAFVHDPLISWRLLGQASDDALTGDSDVSTSNQTPVVSSKVDVGGLSVGAHVVLQEPIREGQEEDSADEESAAPRSAEQPKASEGMGRQPQNDIAMSAANAKSLQMYSSMQTMAADLSASSRIASITGGNARSIAAEASMARSRLDRSLKQREVLSLLEGDESAANEEALNEKAVKVIKRVQDKLAGTDFHSPGEVGDPLDVQDQVQRLIVQATSSENLCQLFIGWCAFW